jgi:hypothetical protein
MGRSVSDHQIMIGDRWGVTEAETRRAYPCDQLVSEPAMEAWRGVTVAARPRHVWPWIIQIRVAPYAYDWIDNLGRRSPRRLLGLPEPRPGDPFTAVGGRPVGRIVSVSGGEHLTGTIMGAYMSYVLVPDDDATRLLLKVVTVRQSAATRLLCLGDLVMARRQLLNLASLAEGSQPASS